MNEMIVRRYLLSNDEFGVVRLVLMIDFENKRYLLLDGEDHIWRGFDEVDIETYVWEGR